ncbi:hypothetical protein A6A20_01045 [Volucribacter amazonae]|uniref:Uncharacterized protein n=1 Tax=Volucribacter amazonae TaxID=256731 RepID=A0A9X4PAT5_9PAST|nr:hypothetical protein [Volucribacter amazonae]
MKKKLIYQDTIVVIYVFIMIHILFFCEDEIIGEYISYLLFFRYNGVTFFIYTPIILLIFQLYYKYINRAMKDVNLLVIIVNFLIMMFLCCSIIYILLAIYYPYL